MYTTTTVAFRRSPMVGGYGGRPTITVMVPWTQQFGMAYQQFVNGGYGSYGGGFPASGLGGLGGGLPMGGGFPAGGLGGYGGGLPMGGGFPAGGLGGYGGGQSMGGGLGGIQGYPIGFGITTD